MKNPRIISPKPGELACPQSALERIDEFLPRQREGISAEQVDLIHRQLFCVLPEVAAEIQAARAGRVSLTGPACFPGVGALEDPDTVGVPG